MRYLIIAILLMKPWVVFSQELFLRSNVGYAIGEMKTFKKIMLVSESLAGYEKPIGRDYCLVAGIGISAVKFGYPDTAGISTFSNRQSLMIPFALKKYYQLSKLSRGYIDFGVYGSYCFSDKKELRKAGVDENQHIRNIGYQFGVSLHIGYRHMITKTISFDLHMNSQSDYFFKYDDELNKLETRKLMAGLTFYKKLN